MVERFLSTPLTILHVLCSLFLVLVILLQPGKGGGLGAFTGAAAQQVFGGGGAGNLLTKSTWVTATIFFLTSVVLGYLSSSVGDSLEGRGHQVHADKKSEPAPQKK
jgi:preprotein translocase subunit SecG